MRLVQQLGRYTMVHFTNVNANATWNMSRRSTVYSNQIRNGSLTVANSSQFSIELQFTIQKWIFCSAAFQEWFCRSLFLRLRRPSQTTLTRTLRVRWSKNDKKVKRSLWTTLKQAQNSLDYICTFLLSYRRGTEMSSNTYSLSQRSCP